MDKKITGIVAYITMIGWIIAFFAGDKKGARFHLNQALVLWLAGIVLGIITNVLTWIIPMVGGILSMAVGIALFVFWIMGLISACQDQEKPLPLIGGIVLLK